MPRTHVIKVEQGNITEPTEFSLVDSATTPESSVSNKAKQSVVDSEQNLITTGGIIYGANKVSQVAQKWLSIKGQNAKANQLKALTGYGTVIAVSMATVPILTTESNASAIYLQEQSRTTVNNSRGDYYRYKF